MGVKAKTRTYCPGNTPWELRKTYIPQIDFI